MILIKSSKTLPSPICLFSITCGTFVNALSNRDEETLALLSTLVGIHSKLHIPSEIYLYLNRVGESNQLRDMYAKVFVQSYKINEYFEKLYVHMNVQDY